MQLAENVDPSSVVFTTYPQGTPAPTAYTPRQRPESPTNSLPRSPCFKVPNPRDFYRENMGGQSRLKLSPKRWPRLINLSFSQPNSPRTPCLHVTPLKSRMATPSHVFNRFKHSQVDQISTPCMMSALHELQMAEDAGLPDMLALIEDDGTGLSQVERQLMSNTDVELTDNTVVDYLLDCVAGEQGFDVSQPADQSQRHQQTFAVSRPALDPNHWHRQGFGIPAQRHPRQPGDSVALCVTNSVVGNVAQQEESGLNVRRKRTGRGQKRMTREEALAVRRQRRRQAREARDVSRGHVHHAHSTRASSSVPTAPRSPGVRRSKRVRRQSSHFKILW